MRKTKHDSIIKTKRKAKTTGISFFDGIKILRQAEQNLDKAGKMLKRIKKMLLVLYDESEDSWK